MPPPQTGKASFPVAADIAFDAFHVPANRAGAGHAWYDVFALGETCFAVTIGNVAAGDHETASLMRALRGAFAARAVPVGSAALLSAADAVLRRQPVCAAVAALVGIVDCTARTFTYLSSGHSPPYVRYHDGRVMGLPALGLPLGRAPGDYPAAQVEFDLGGTALLVLSSGTPLDREDDDAARRLQQVLADERLAQVGAPAAWIASRMLDALAPAGAALVTMTFPPGRAAPKVDAGEPPSWKVSWSFDSTAAAANGARRAFLACLASKDRGGKAIDLAAAELIFGELLGNVVRHAPGPVDIALDWTGDLPVLHVLDSGPGFRSRRKRERLPLDDWSESGRGLFIVNACATQFSVRNRNGRGTHASATLPAA